MTRPVTVFEWWRPERTEHYHPYEKREVGAGNFHQFGLDCTEEGTFSTAIVEMPDGSVLNVEVGLIRFDDDGGEAGRTTNKG